jgi:hypothetical protein
LTVVLLGHHLLLRISLHLTLHLTLHRHLPHLGLLHHLRLSIHVRLLHTSHHIWLTIHLLLLRHLLHAAHHLRLSIHIRLLHTHSSHHLWLTKHVRLLHTTHGHHRLHGLHWWEQHRRHNHLTDRCLKELISSRICVSSTIVKGGLLRFSQFQFLPELLLLSHHSLFLLFKRCRTSVLRLGLIKHGLFLSKFSFLLSEGCFNLYLFFSHCFSGCLGLCKLLL